MDPMHYGIICKYSLKECHNDNVLKADIDYVIENKEHFVQWLGESLTPQNVEMYIKSNTSFKEIINDYFEISERNMNKDSNMNTSNPEDLSGMTMEQHYKIIDYDTNTMKSVLLERNQKSNDKNKSIQNIFKI